MMVCMHLARKESFCTNLKEDCCCMEAGKKVLVWSTAMTDTYSYLTFYSFVFLFLDFREQAMCSVGFCVINSLKRCYPLEDATHIALRKLKSNINWMAEFRKSLTSDRQLLIWGNLFLGGCSLLEAVKRQGLSWLIGKWRIKTSDPSPVEMRKDPWESVPELAVFNMFN